MDLVVTIDKSGVTVSDVNDAMKKAAEGSLKGILDYSDKPLVSIDFNGSTSFTTLYANFQENS